MRNKTLKGEKKEMDKKGNVKVEEGEVKEEG